jgi:hypothetical protein
MGYLPILLSVALARPFTIAGAPAHPLPRHRALYVELHGIALGRCGDEGLLPAAVVAIGLSSARRVIHWHTLPLRDRAFFKLWLWQQQQQQEQEKAPTNLAHVHPGLPR